MVVLVGVIYLICSLLSLVAILLFDGLSCPWSVHVFSINEWVAAAVVSKSISVPKETPPVAKGAC